MWRLVFHRIYEEIGIPPDICGDWYSTGYMWRLVFHRIYVEIGIPPNIYGDWYSTGYMWRLVFHRIYVEIGIPPDIFGDWYSTIYMWRLVFYSHVKNTCMIKSVHLRKDGWAHTTSLTPPLFIETSVPLKPAK